MAPNEATSESVSATLRSIFELLQIELGVLEGGRWKQIKESERSLLSTLSKVHRYLQSITFKATCSIQLNVEVEKRDFVETREEVGNLAGHVDERNISEILEELTQKLVAVLASESDFVAHSVGKALVALSHVLIEINSLWTLILHILWNAVEAWSTNSEIIVSRDTIHYDNSIGHSKPFKSSSVLKAADLQSPGSQVYVCTHSTVRHGIFGPGKNWTAVFRSIQLLHNIFKSCIHESPSRLENFLNVTESHLKLVVVNAMTYILPLYYVKVVDCNSLNVSNNESKQFFEGELLLGALLRLLCSVIRSMVIHSNSQKTGGTIFHCQFLKQIETLIPALATVCLAPHSHPIFGGCVSTFLRHKMLMIFCRLSVCFTEQPSLAVLCMDNLQSHASDLLSQLLFQKRTLSEYNLLGSPFVPTLVQNIKLNQTASVCHLQRRAVFLAFKVVLSLKSVSQKRTEGISESAEVSNASWERHKSVKEISEEGRCVAQLEEWLISWLIMQMKLVGDISNFELVEVANGLALSFLELFLDEDDLMLEMLLLLLDLPILMLFSNDQDSNIKSTVHCVLVAAMQPLRLFSAFLAKVNYDHTIILDYLISNDVSTLCLRYLLRCLHIVHNSWPEFIFLSSVGFNVPSPQAEKQVIDSCCLKDSPQAPEQDHYVCDYQLSCISSVCPQVIDTGQTINASSTDVSGPSEVRKELEVDCPHKLGQKICSHAECKPVHYLCEQIDMTKAADSLLRLKLAIQRMHHKSIFPYNPSALLRCLKSFQLLWQE